jgi:RNA polymerase sigma factor (sigma-70 family)
MLGSPEEAEDAVQHTFSSAYRALLRDDRAIALRAWLYAIARNRCLSMLAARREQVALDDVEATLPSTTGLALEVEQRSDLRALLADMQRLPDDQRAALVLAELEAHSHKEIASILGVAPAKVKALVFQARETLMTLRQARDTSCVEIREQLATLHGGGLRRRELRRHVESCAGCRMFRSEVLRQRAGMALLIPVAPTLALKHSALAAAFATTTSAAAGIGAIAGGGAVAGGLTLGTNTIGLKALAVLAVAAGAGGGGYAAVDKVADRRQAPASAPAPAQRSLGPGQMQARPAVSPVTAANPPARGAAAAPTARATSPAKGKRAKERSGGGSSAAARADKSAAKAARAAARSARGAAKPAKPKPSTATAAKPRPQPAAKKAAKPTPTPRSKQP